jgi:hypothetical protein
MTRTVLFVLLTAVVSSCLTNGPSSGIDAKARQDSTLKRTILGTWGIYVETSDGVDALCNVCPKIHFLDRTAVITMSDKPRDTLLFEIRVDTVAFNSMTGRPESIFIQNGSYRPTLTRKDESQELTIKHATSDLEYTLRRYH